MRPRDAATLIIVRERAQVLLGMRNARHVFMPHCFVFPGGAVDAGDARVPSPATLQKPVEQRLTQSVTAARARALAMAAVRETFEETGLIVGRPAPRPMRSRSEHWRPFYAKGVVPALDKLGYFARAITPPGLVRRFDARFFTVDARHVSGDIDGNGELGDLQWVALEDTHKLPLAPITGLILELLRSELQPGVAGPHDPLKFQAIVEKELKETHPVQLP